MEEAFQFGIYPNPATEQLNIRFALTEASNASIQIVGMDVKMVLSEELLIERGNHILNLNTEQLSKGIYILNVATNEFSESTQLVVK